MSDALIVDLMKVKAIFQQRAICAAMGIENPASLCQAHSAAQAVQGMDAQIASMGQHAAPVDAQDGGAK